MAIYDWPKHNASGVELTEELKDAILKYGPRHPDHPEHKHEDCCK